MPTDKDVQQDSDLMIYRVATEQHGTVLIMIQGELSIIDQHMIKNNIDSLIKELASQDKVKDIQ